MKFPTVVRLCCALFLVAAAGCGGGSAGQPPAGQPPQFQTFTSQHFTFRYTDVDAANIATTAQRVEQEYARILGDLQAQNMPVVQVTLYADHNALEAAVPFPVPDWAAGLATSATQIHMMSPNLTQWGSYDVMIGNLVHEFAHCVSLHLNPQLGNNPRWWWESVAIYEALQFRDPHALPYMVNHQPPTFAQLNDINNVQIYEVGYLIAEYVEAQYGAPALNALILSNGNTVQTLGVEQAQFEQDWFAWARATYGF
jgi:hypothetical protein